jgi:hypothetical protein
MKNPRRRSETTGGGGGDFTQNLCQATDFLSNILDGLAGQADARQALKRDNGLAAGDRFAVSSSEA